MGICASCLGYRDKNSDESASLLSPNNQYGAYHGYGAYSGAPQPVSDQDLVREREVLERIVTRATETLIDIMAQTSQHQGIAGGFVGEEREVGEYRDILANISPPQLPEMPRPLSPSSVSKEERKWLDELTVKAEDALSQVTKVKDVGKLVVTLDFLDA